MSGKKSRLSRDDSATAGHLLKFLETQPDIQEFLRPVDYKRLGLPDYPTIVKKPMDISTIKRNTKTGVYSHLNEVAQDVMLIWANCKLYNPPELLIHQQAVRLEKVTQEYLETHHWGLPSKRPRDEPVVVTHEHKLELVNALQLLSGEELGNILKLVHSLIPEALLKLDEDRVQIKIEKLEGDPFFKILQ